MGGWKSAVQLSVLLCCCLAAVQGQLTVTSLPAVLFSGGSQRIVEGSVVWLYCEVNSTESTLIVIWNKDNVPLVQDVPHIRIRNFTSDTSTTFLLVVDNFQASDNGTYQCTAQDKGATANGTALTLTAYSDGSLRIVMSPIDGDGIPDNRTGYQMGNTATLSFEIGHVGDDSTSYSTPSVMWLKDGTPVRATPTDAPDTNGHITTTLSFTFQESDAGVYQCVITGNNSELLATIPIRLDTGETRTLERVSPSSIIILRPPDKLVLEVRATGRYTFIQWRRNTASFEFIPDRNFTVTLQELSNFFEIFVREPTTRDDLGVFTAELSPTITTDDFIHFAVVGAVDASTTVNGGASVVTVSEGGSVDISCTSTGVPAPTITWRLNNQATPFNQTDQTTTADIKININFGVDTIISGSVVSTLHIVNAQYPAHDGVYECIGDNSNGGSAPPGIANITVQVQVPLNLTDPLTDKALTVNETDNVTLSCSALGVPEPSIVWFPSTGDISSSSTMTDEGINVSSTLTISNVVRSNAGSYTCNVSNAIPSSMTRTFNISIRFPPNIIMSPSSIALLRPAALSLTCTANGVPAPTFTWIRTLSNGSEIEFSMDSTDIDGRTLTITNNSPLEFSMTVESVFMINSTIILDTANYSCMATNELGSENSITQVSIYAVPSISSPTEAQRFQTNEQTNITFTCMASGLPAPSLSFQYEGDVLNHTDGVMGIGKMLVDRVQVGTEMMVLNSDDGVYNVTRTLTLFNAVDGDTGNFTCSASVNIPDIGTRMDTVTFELTVLVHPSITTPPMNQVVVAGMNVSLSCVVEGLPRPSITWFIMTSEGRVELDAMNHDIQTRNGSGQRQVMSTLSLVSVQPITANAYFCNASNVVGDVVTMANLTVHTVPAIEVFPENLTVDQFQMAAFECSATGIPAPAIRWFRYLNGETFELLQTDPNINIGDPVQIDNYVLSNGRGLAFAVNSSLTLLEASDSNNGLYVCVAINVAGNDTGVFQLTVQVAANITDSPQALIVTAPNPVTFSCTASGLPRPSITWLDPSSAVLMSGSGGVTITEMRIGERVLVSTLNISTTVPSNSGNYTCIADNGVTGQGDLNRVDATLSVHVTPEVTSVMNYTVDLGNTATFQCVATGIPASTITWFRGGVELNESNSRVMLNAPSTTMVMSTSITGEMVYEVTRTLTLSMSRDEDSGTYQCRATNAAMPGMDTMDFELIVQIPPATPTITDEAALIVTQPASAMFVCTAMARPRPSITWYRVEFNNSRTNLTGTTETGVTITTVNGNMERDIQSTLLFNLTRPSFTAIYVCVATNPAGSAETNASLTVHVTPEVTSVMDYTVNLGDTATFQCVATGIPAPTITWFRGGVELNASDPRVTFNASSISTNAKMVYQVTRTLTLDMTEDNDSDTYQCRATNAAMPGMDTMDFTLIVQIPPIPTIRDEAALIVTEPASAMFICIAVARPRPSIMWYRVELDDSRTNLTETAEVEAGVTITTVNGNTERETRSTLLFDPTRLSFTAEYVCEATNPVDSAETSVNLTVHVTPEVISVYPDPSQVNYTVNLGNTATFQCVATGIPAPSITWFRGGVELNASDPRVTFNTPSNPIMVNSTSIADSEEMVYQVTRTLTLSMSRDEDSGTYQCRATNAAMPDNDTMDFELIVQIPPATPNITNQTALTVTEPAPATFICTAVARPRPSIRWYRVGPGGTSRTVFNGTDNGVTIATVNGNTDRETQSTLLFNHTRPSFTAVYICEATNPVASAEINASLTVHVTPEVTNVYPDPSQMNYTVNVSNTATLQCVATGIPAPTITWFRGGVELNASDPRVTFNAPSTTMVMGTSIAGEMVYQVNRTLTLSMSRDEDSGTYQCRATNAAMPGMDTMDFELIVQIPPATPNIRDEATLTVTQPASAMFVCTAMARPRPSIRWYRVELDNSRTNLTGTDDGVTITTENGNTEREINSTLLFEPARPSFTAEYVCEATNPVARAETSVNLTVHVNPNITVFLPDGDSRYVVNMSDSAIFQCNATGVPPPLIQWFRGQELLNMSTDTRITLSDPYVVDPPRELATVGRTLTIRDTVNNDTGSYSCRASNAAEGRMDTETFELFIQVPPQVVPLNNDQRVIANESTSAVLMFRIDQAAPPVETSNIRWYYTARAPSGTPDFTSSNFQDITDLMNRTSRSMLSFSSDRFSLNISNIVQARQTGEETDAGRYFMRASNPAGEDSDYIELIVFGRPQIVEGPQDQFAINNGSSAVFTCNAIAFPLHHISWSFRNFTGFMFDKIVTTDSVSDTEKYSVVRDRNGTFGQLTVRNVLFQDRGTYICEAMNDPGSESAQANLTVHVIPIIQQISSPNDTLLTESVAIFCLATGYPIPTFTWQKGGGNIDNTDTNDRIDIFSFFPRLDSETTDFESELMMNDSISELLMMNTDISVDVILSLGELGIVSVLNINSVVREDTDNYTCTIRNQLPQTTTITRISNPVPLVVLERPDPPINATSFVVGSRWIALRWTPTFDGNRPVFGFLIYISNVSISQNFTQVANLMASNLMTRGRSFMFNISGGDTILPFTRYSFRVVSCNEIGCSDQSESSPPRQTGQDTATAPLNLATSAPTNSSLTLTWSPPQTPNGIVTAYNVSYTGRKSYNTSFSQVGFRMFDAVDLNGAVLGRLTPGTNYLLTVAAINEAGTGMSSQTAVGVTESLPPPPPIVPTLPPELIMSSDDGNPLTIVIPVPNFSTENGPISHYQIVVVIIPEGQTLSDLPSPSSVKTMDPYSADFCDQNSPTPVFYVTAEFGENLFPPQNHFIVGIDKNTDSNSPNDRPNAYANGPLCYSKSYTFFIRAFNGIISRQGSRQARQVSSQRQYESSTSTSYIPQITTSPPPPPIGIAVGVVIAVLVVIIVIVVVIIVVILVYRRYSDKTDYYEPTEMEFQKNGGSDAIVLMEYVPPEEGSDVRQPVPLTALSSHVDRMHLNENCGFGEEYRIIQDKSPKKPVEVCISPDNKPRNRYANIQCFDETRVILKPVEGAEHDYINASFIEGYNRKREYIAAQGPLPDTLGDFWRMVWEYNVPTVIMLTNLVEKAKVKCSQYWPNKGTIDYGNISVTLVNTVTHADFVLRQFTIKNKFFEEVKEVRQYHFISWPDFGVPRHATPLLYFLRRVRNSHKYSNQKPMIVHCSAGVGRTGTFITIDMELQRAEGDQCMDPFNTVKHMRQERNHMVQTEAQYIFLHDAILEGVNSGKTEVPVDQLNKRMKILEEVDKEDESGYKKEFLLLRQFKVNVREFTDANDDANKFKNRLANALPYNYNRVHLQMRPGIGGSDYINASYIDGYAKKGAYIATQGPLRNTVGDFWRMIWEGEVNSIVMLTQLEEKGKVQSAQYWPSTKDSPEKMDEFITELVSEGAFEDYVVREIKLTQATSGKTRTVKHFHFLSWPENGAPASGAGMVDLIDQVTRTQQRTGDKPIVVHCSAGIGRTGAFCALSTAIEKLKAEQMVDVFHTIKHLRTQRPHMVQNVDQYIFCYRAIREYVDSQSNYMQFQSND